MGTLRQPSLDGGPLFKHTSIPNLLYLYVYLYVSFNHSLPLALHGSLVDFMRFHLMLNHLPSFPIMVLHWMRGAIKVLIRRSLLKTYMVRVQDGGKARASACRLIRFNCTLCCGNRTIPAQFIAV